MRKIFILTLILLTTFPLIFAANDFAYNRLYDGVIVINNTGGGGGNATNNHALLTNLFFPDSGHIIGGFLDMADGKIRFDNNDSGVQRLVNASCSNSLGICSYGIDNDAGAGIAMSVAGSAVPNFENDAGILCEGGRCFISTLNNESIIFGTSPDNNFENVDFSIGIETRLGALEFQGSKFIRPVQVDGGFGLLFQSTEALQEGGFPYIYVGQDSDNNTVVLGWDQNGRNNSFSGQMNSFGVVPKTWTNFSGAAIGNETEGIEFLFNRSDYIEYCNYLQNNLSLVPEDCRYFADTSGRLVPLLFGGDLEVHRTATIHEALTVFNDFDYITRTDNDFDIFFTNISSPAELHIRDRRTILENVTNFSFTVCNFDDGTLCDFYVIPVNPARDWRNVIDVNCHEDRCAQADGGGGDKAMCVDTPTLGATNINVSFWFTMDIGELYVEADDNDGNLTEVFSNVGATIDEEGSFVLSSTYENKSNVTICFYWDGINVNREVWLDEVTVSAQLNPAQEINETYEGGRTIWGEDRGSLSCAVDTYRQFNNQTLNVEWYMDIGCPDGNTRILGNTSFVDVTLENQTIIGDQLVTGDLTVQGDLTVEGVSTFEDTITTENIEPAVGGDKNIGDSINRFNIGYFKIGAFSTSITTEFVNGNLIPFTDSTWQIGTLTKRWSNGFFDAVDTTLLKVNSGVFSDLLPQFDNTYDIGSETNRWAEGWFINHYVDSDTGKSYYGEVQDGSLGYNGSDLVANPREVGTGNFVVEDGNYRGRPVQSTSNYFEIHPQNDTNYVMAVKSPTASWSGSGDKIQYHFPDQNHAFQAEWFGPWVAYTTDPMEFKTRDGDDISFHVNTGGIDNAGSELLTLKGNTDVVFGVGDLYIPNDNAKIFFGAGDDGSITYDGGDMLFDSQEAGTGNFEFRGGDALFYPNDVLKLGIGGSGAYTTLTNYKTGGLLFETTNGGNNGRYKVLMGEGFRLGETLSDNLSQNLLTIKRDVDGASTYSESGALIKLERDITNVVSESGYYFNADDIVIIDNNGSLGIGAAPNYELDVNGIIRSYRSGTGAVQIVDRTDGLIGALQAGTNEVSFMFDNTAPNGFRVIKQTRANIEQGTASGATNLFEVRTDEDVYIPNDNAELTFGDNQDIGMYWGGTNFVINPQKTSATAGIRIGLDDSVPIKFGAGQDSIIEDDGSNMIINPDENAVGSRPLIIDGDLEISNSLNVTGNLTVGPCTQYWNGTCLNTECSGTQVQALCP